MAERGLHVWTCGDHGAFGLEIDGEIRVGNAHCFDPDRCPVDSYPVAIVQSSSSVEQADDAVFAIRQALAWIEQDKPNMAAHRLQAFLDSSSVPAGERDVSEGDER